MVNNQTAQGQKTIQKTIENNTEKQKAQENTRNQKSDLALLRRKKVPYGSARQPQ